MADKEPDKKSSAADFAAKYRLPTDYKQSHGVTTALTICDVGTPDGQAYLRCRLNEDDPVLMPCVKPKGERTVYIVSPDVAPHLGEWTYSAHLVQCVTRYGRSFIWPVRLPDSDAKDNRYSESCITAAKRAVDEWIQIRWSQLSMAYECRIPEEPIDAVPEWPNEDFMTLVGMAFKGRTIDDLDHPEAKKLLGRAL